jgi:hypothetical protein
MAYTISVKRGKADGTLSYSGSISVSTKCWWDIANKIPAAEYPGCSKTMMHSKHRKAIFIPDVPGHTGIFIHKGTSASWSKGCIVIAESQMLKIWNDITPEDGRNVTVEVTDD